MSDGAGDEDTALLVPVNWNCDEIMTLHATRCLRCRIARARALRRQKRRLRRGDPGE